jgi:hypothetical protein
MMLGPATRSDRVALLRNFDPVDLKGRRWLAWSAVPLQNRRYGRWLIFANSIFCWRRLSPTISRRNTPSTEQSEKDYERYKKLSDTAVSQQRFEQAQATAQEAKAAYDQAVADRDVAKLNLERSTVRASVNGRITNMDLRPGAYVTVGIRTRQLAVRSALRRWIILKASVYAKADQRVDQFMRLRDAIEERVSRKFFEGPVETKGPVVLRSNDFLETWLHGWAERTRTRKRHFENLVEMSRKFSLNCGTFWGQRLFACELPRTSVTQREARPLARPVCGGQRPWADRAEKRAAT